LIQSSHCSNDQAACHSYSKINHTTPSERCLLVAGWLRTVKVHQDHKVQCSAMQQFAVTIRWMIERCTSTHRGSHPSIHPSINKQAGRLREPDDTTASVTKESERRGLWLTSTGHHGNIDVLSGERFRNAHGCLFIGVVMNCWCCWTVDSECFL